MPLHSQELAVRVHQAFLKACMYAERFTFAATHMNHVLATALDNVVR